MSWVSLHTHSQYSILDALASVKELALKAKELGMPGLALTDHGNLYGAVEFYEACREAQVKPIIGCEVYVAPESRHEKKKVGSAKTAFHLVLLAKNAQGYHNLCKLSSIAFTEGFYYHPRIDKELLAQHCEGLVCLSACLSGEVAQVALTGDRSRLLETIAYYKTLFKDDYYLELQRHSMSVEAIESDGFLQESWLYQQYDSFIRQQTKVNELLVDVAGECGVKLVATNDIHYIAREDWRAHEVLLNIQSGEPCEIWEKDSLGNLRNKVPNPKRRTYASHELYFKSIEQMAALFADLPGALENTLEVADKCAFAFDLKAKHYPVYIPPSLEGKSFEPEERRLASEVFLRQLCEEAIARRYTVAHLEEVKRHYPNRDPLEVVRERLEMEMDVIIPKGMCDYLLIVWDFIDWAKRQGIPVGPGRGSGAGSIILYLIGITDIEPLRFSLFFERFINPERLSYPDIDVDICMDRRPEVIEYTVQKYGKESVAQIITFGTMKAKMAIKDVGRVLSVPLTRVNGIAKLVPDDLNMTLDRALELDPELLKMYEEDGETGRLLDLAKRLEGCVRNTGIHAAGIIICGEPLSEHIPICVAKDSDMAVTQYSMKPLEKVGMLKIDFLGLKTLTCIQKAKEALESTGRKLDPLTLPLDDRNSFNLLNQGRTLGVFQMESGGMQDLARQLHLDRFEEIIAVVALYRPGPMEMIPSYINRKHGREAIEYDHPWMEEILSETYGIMVYQEQVMQMAQRLANYSLGEGDVLRKAMGKKVMEEMASQREKFRSGAKKNEIDDETAVRIFDRMEQFAKYGFNKSHAASYALLTYITAYLKANYPREWMAALMTCDRDDTSKVSRFIRECQAMEIPILPPDVNEATDAFMATPQGIRFAMNGIKGVGQGVVETIIAERKVKGPYLSLFDFMRRIELKKVGKKTIEILADAGCFDFTGWSRDELRQSVAPMYEVAHKEQQEKDAGVMSLFALMKGEEGRFTVPPKVEVPSTQAERLMREKELLGFFVTGHPMDQYRSLGQQLGCIPMHEIGDKRQGGIVRTAFIIDSVTTKLTTRGQRKFAVLMISDGFESFELPIWPDLYEEKGHLLAENQMLFAVIQFDSFDEAPKLNCKWIEDLTKVNGMVIEEADRAFDRAKAQINFSARTPRKEMAMAPKPTSSAKGKESWAITFSMEEVRLTHILRLKELLLSAPGDTPVKLRFVDATRVVATLRLDGTYSVSITEALTREIGSIPSASIL